MMPTCMTRKQDERKKVMGMAASQARFLGLTARQNNVEYEGQQVNQQRTTLSNQSANYYNQLLGMQVPVPPSVADYTKTVYTFEDGSLSNSITSMIAQQGGLFKISYISSWVDDFAAVSAPQAIVTRTVNNPSGNAADYKVGAKTLRQMTSNKTPIPQAFIDQDEYLSTLSSGQLSKLLDEEAEYIKILKAQYGGTDSDWAVRYVQNTTTGTWSPYFTKISTLQMATFADDTVCH